MKNSYIIYIAFLLLTVSCKKQTEQTGDFQVIKTVKFPQGSDPKYLSNHPKSDTMCSNDIQKAKDDIAKYNKLYIKTICYGCRNKPFKTELEKVLKSRKIKQVIEDISCVGYEGQTQGCYSGYINLKMREKYGENYFSEIEKEAEKMFIKNLSENNKIISVYDLENNEKPKILNPKIQIESDYYTTIKVNLPVKIDTYKSLFADITFIIEKDGTISNLSVSNWVNDAVDEKFNKDLIAIGLKSLKEDYNKWKPGNYKGNVARTENTLRVNFEN
jgi:hypothetical protein